MTDKQIRELVRKQLGTGYALTPTAEHIGYITDRNGDRYKAYDRVEVCNMPSVNRKPTNDNVITFVQGKKQVQVLKNGEYFTAFESVKETHSLLYTLGHAPKVPRRIEWLCEYTTTKALNLLSLLQAYGTELSCDIYALKEKNREYVRNLENDEQINRLATLIRECHLTKYEVEHVDELLPLELLEFWSLEWRPDLYGKLLNYAQVKEYRKVPEFEEWAHKSYVHITLTTGRQDPLLSNDCVVPYSAYEDTATQNAYNRACY